MSVNITYIEIIGCHRLALSLYVQRCFLFYFYVTSHNVYMTFSHHLAKPSESNRPTGFEDFKTFMSMSSCCLDPGYGRPLQAVLKPMDNEPAVNWLSYSYSQSVSHLHLQGLIQMQPACRETYDQNQIDQISDYQINYIDPRYRYKFVWVSLQAFHAFVKVASTTGQSTRLGIFKMECRHRINKSFTQSSDHLGCGKNWRKMSAESFLSSVLLRHQKLNAELLECTMQFPIWWRKKVTAVVVVDDVATDTDSDDWSLITVAAD